MIAHEAMDKEFHAASAPGMRHMLRAMQICLYLKRTDKLNRMGRPVKVPT